MVVVLAACAGTTSRPAALPSYPALGASPASRHLTPPHVTSRDQVRQVVDRYFAILNRLHHDMTSAALAGLLTPACPCQQQVRAIRTAAAKGQRYLDRIRVLALRVNLDGRSAADVLADYRLQRGGLVDAHGHRVSRVRPHRVRWDFRLRRTVGRWRIDRIDDLS